MSQVLSWQRARYSLALLCAFILIAMPDGGTVAASSETPSETPFYTSPVESSPPTILREFEKPPKKWMAGHRGIDMAASAGSPVLSPADGEVTFSGKVVDRTVITVKHPDGRISSFEPVTAPLPKGSAVKAGDVIAHVDKEIKHCEAEACLHWGVRTGKDEYINPLLLLGLDEPSILLPIGEDFAA